MTSPPPELPILHVLSANYYYDAQDNYPDFVPLKMTPEAVRDHGPPRDALSSSSSSTSSSGSSRHKKKKVKKKKKKKKKKKVTIPYKAKSGDIKLPSWPTTMAFPAWRRTLRQAVISASDRPERARLWISAVESVDVIMEDMACADDDRHRTLDAKLAEALTKILKGEPARKMALAAERAALSHDICSCRQCFLLIYPGLRRTEAKSDAAAHSNLENICCGSADTYVARWGPFYDVGELHADVQDSVFGRPPLQRIHQPY